MPLQQLHYIHIQEVNLIIVDTFLKISISLFGKEHCYYFYLIIKGHLIHVNAPELAEKLVSEKASTTYKQLRISEAITPNFKHTHTKNFMIVENTLIRNILQYDNSVKKLLNHHKHRESQRNIPVNKYSSVAKQ